MHRGSAAKDPFRPFNKLSLVKLEMKTVTSQAALRQIVVQLTKNHRPTYLGELSMAVGDSLERIEQLIEHLQEIGAVRYATTDEKIKLGLSANGSVIILLDEKLVPHVER